MKRLLALMLAMLLTLPLCGHAALAESPVHYIDGGSADRVHLRAAPFLDADSLGLYYTGTDVIVIDFTGEWAWVMVGAETGYIMQAYLTLEYTNRPGCWYVVDNPHSTWANLRTAPSMDGMIALCPDNGTRLEVLGETKSGWSYVDCGGVKGYILTSLLTELLVEAPAQTAVLGSTADGYYIHQYTAPNGQNIYFTALEENVHLVYEDVNFDGHEDLVVHTVMGASNFYSEFFVYSPAADAYVRVANDSGEERLCNYQLYPEYGLVETRSNNGNAGLLHVWNLYRWEGDKLILVRSAVSDEWSEDIFEGSTYTQIIHGDILHVVVRDHTAYDESVLWEITIPKADTEYRDIFTEEAEALWQGVR